MSVVGIVILITLILLLQLVSQMLAAPPSPVLTEQELRQRIAALQPVLKEIQDSITELQRAKDQSEVFTPSEERVDALQSTLERLESEIAHSEKRIQEIKNRTDTLQNSPAIRQLEKTQQEVQALTEISAEAARQTEIALENTRKIQEKVQELKAKNAGLDTQLAGQAAIQLKVTIPAESGKTAFILDYGQGTINVIPTDGSPLQTFSSRSQFSAWVSRRDYAKEHFVVYLRPSRFGELGDAIIKELQVKGFDVGLQVIGEKTSLFLND